MFATDAFSSVLSLAEGVASNKLTANALLQDLAVPKQGEFAKRARAHYWEQERLRMEPYSDILFRLIADKMEEHKDEMIEHLRGCEITQLRVPIFTWKTVSYNESLSEMQYRVSQMTPDERVEHVTKIAARAPALHDGESWIGITGEAAYLPPVKVNRVINSSDLFHRLMGFLGPCFRPKMDLKRIADAHIDVWDPDYCYGYRIYEKTLVAEYCPLGLPLRDLKPLLAAAQAYWKRSEDSKVYYVMDKENITTLDDLLANTLPFLPSPAATEEEEVNEEAVTNAAILSVLGHYFHSTGATKMPCHCEYGCSEDEV